MRPGRELDCFVAQNVLNHPIVVKQKQLWEETELGVRPLLKYTKDMSAAWIIAEKMGITVIPVQPNTWFAFVGKGSRWENPAEFIAFMQKGDFMHSGAAVGENPAETICQAAFHAIQKTTFASEANAVATQNEAAETSPALN